jgi:tetratricopeptide (TPR) repeat protein
MASQSAQTLLEQGRSEKRERRFENARDLFRTALDESPETGDLALRGTILEELAYVERTLGELESAQAHYRDAAEVYRGLDQPLKAAHTARHAADVLREQGKLDGAEILYAEALQIYRSHKESPPLDLANAIRGFALLNEATRNGGLALKLWEEARELYEGSGMEAGVSESDARIKSLAGA